MRIALLGSLNTGGVGRFTSSLAKSISEANHQVSVINVSDLVSPGRSEFSGELRATGIPIIKYADLLARPISLSRLAREFDLLHISYASLGLPLLKLFRLHSKPVVYTAHSFPQPSVENVLWKKIGYTVEHMALPKVAKASTRFVTISDYAKKEIQRIYSLRADVIHNGTDTTTFSPADENHKLALRAKYQVMKDSIVILSVGSLSFFKNYKRLVDSLPSLVKSLGELQVVVIGEGPEEVDLIRRATRLGVIGSLRLVRPPAKILDWYQMADIYVSTAINEGFGLSITEAMACGLPVVAPSTGACPEVLGSVSTMYDFLDAGEPSRVLRTLVSSQDERLQVGSAMRQRVVHEFALTTMARGYLNLYTSLDRNNGS